MRLTAIASEIREIPRNSLKNSNLWSSRSSKVIDIGVNRKPICDLLLVINSNLAVSATVFELLTLEAGKSLILLTPPVFNAP